RKGPYLRRIPSLAALPDAAGGTARTDAALSSRRSRTGPSTGGRRSGGIEVELLRTARERDNAPDRDDRAPIENVDEVWASAAQMATIGIFVVALGACLYFCRPILLPVFAGLVVGMTLAPIVKAARRFGIPPWITALVLGAALLAATGAAVTWFAAPVTEWISKAPEIGATIKQKLYVLDRPLAALRELQDAVLGSSGPAAAPSQLGIVTP